MKMRPLFWQVFPAFVAIVLCATFTAAWYASHAVQTFHYRCTEERLGAAAGIAIDRLLSTLDSLEARSDVDPICDSLGEASGYRITVILPSGEVTGDSHKDPAVMDDHSARPEILQAKRTGEGCSRRFSNTLDKNMMYVAVTRPGVGAQGTVVRASLPLTDVDATVNSLRTRILITGLVLAVAAVGVSVAVSRRISRPIQRMRDGAERFAEGDLSVRLAACDIAEMNQLGRTMNTMAEQLQGRIDEITRQRDEQDALFGCMTESVIAVDTDHRVIKMNDAAQKLFNVDAAECRGRNIVEVIRNSELHDIVEKALSGTTPSEGGVHLLDSDVHLQAHGAVLRGASGNRIGAVIILNDVTRMRRLETMRQDFVANMSHELKTPITSVLASVETLNEGAAEEKADRDRFLGIIHRHALRLRAIVEDLLVLSRIEHDVDREKIELSETGVASVLGAAVQACRMAAEKKSMAVEVQCPPELNGRLDRELIEQAVTYLVDNAIKYSDEGKSVVVEARDDEEAVVISVKDEGPGIAPQHVSRLFERFYRVDKGRSREQGGTGLGLAIVKHIASVHGGTVDVTTALEQGSTFLIRLPKRGQVS